MPNFLEYLLQNTSIGAYGGSICTLQSKWFLYHIVKCNSIVYFCVNVRYRRCKICGIYKNNWPLGDTYCLNSMFIFDFIFYTMKHQNSGHIRVLKNLSVIKRCPLLGGSLKKIVTFGTKYFVDYWDVRYWEISLYYESVLRRVEMKKFWEGLRVCKKTLANLVRWLERQFNWNSLKGPNT